MGHYCELATANTVISPPERLKSISEAVTSTYIILVKTVENFIDLESDTPQ